LLDGVQVGQRGVYSLLRCSVDLTCGPRHYTSAGAYALFTTIAYGE
jgi:hypothetical protein